MNTAATTTPPCLDTPAPGGRRRGKRRLEPQPHHRQGGRGERRVRADVGTTRGVIWTLVIAFDFFMLSNPAVLISPFRTALIAALVCTAAAVVLTLPWMRLPTPPWAVLAFLCWASLSTIWSINFEATANAVGLYVAVALIAMFVTANVTALIIVAGFALGAVAVVVASVIALHLDLPGAAVPLGTEGYLAGVGSNRNILAYTLVLALPMLLCTVPRRWAVRVLWIIALIAVLGGIYASSSGTGIFTSVLLVALAVALPLLQVIKLRRGKAVAGVATSVLVAPMIAAVLFFDQIASLLGKDSSTISGRAPLWSAAFQVTEQKPLLGYGWGAVWPHPWAPAPDNTVVEDIYSIAGVALTHGHNSWLDVLPEIGFVGAGLAVVMFIVVIVRVWGPSHDLEVGLVSPAVRLALLSLTGQLVFGLTEPILTIPLGWFVLTSMTQLPLPVGATKEPAQREVTPHPIDSLSARRQENESA